MKNAFFAFLVGGGICFFGELIRMGLSAFFKTEDAYIYTTLILIALASLLTALGIYDKIARIGGGGTIVPVSGFSNAISSAAIDSRSEGFILGVGAKIFTVAGPVILYGTIAGTVYGLIYYIYTLFL